MKTIKAILITLLTALTFTTLSAQSTIQKTITGVNDELTWAINTDADGNFLISGFTTSAGQGNRDVLIIKMDPMGTVLFSKTYGSAQGDWASHIDNCSDGGYVIAGTSQQSGQRDMYVIRTDASGDTMWTRLYGGLGNEEAQEIKQTADGGFVIVGYTNTWGQGNKDVYMIKTDSNGVVAWSKTYGGAMNEEGQSVIQTPDGRYTLLGWTESFGAGLSDFYVIRTDEFGDTLWTKTFGGAALDIGKQLVRTHTGGYAFMGYTESYGQGQSDGLLITTNSNGIVQFAKAYGSDSTDIASNFIQTADSGFIFTGRTNGLGAVDYDAMAFKTDKDGNLLWGKRYGDAGYEDAFNSAPASENGAVLAARTSSFGAQGVDSYIIKIDEIGNSGCNDASISLSSNPVTPQVSNGGVVTSNGQSSVTTTVVANTSLPDSILCYTCLQTDAYYNFAVDDPSLTVTYLDSSSNAVAWFWDFDDGTTSTIQNPVHTYSTWGVFYVCLITTNDCSTDTSCQTVVVQEIGVGNDLNSSLNTMEIFPNPNNGSFTVKFKEAGRLEIVDVVGQIVYGNELSTHGTVQVGIDLADGVYFIRFATKKNVGAKKIIIRK